LAHRRYPPALLAVMQQIRDKRTPASDLPPGCTSAPFT